ncbi:hypothetical protein BGI51_20440 [Pseudomonas oryzihabitans]|jgi:hypothetical protein|uniref:DUF1993 domain-containing protein n=1 Tax=Pseudomonas oryzihabitans TaxID=47885 RepID=UPI00165D4890|nr:DUF1993 domain-containing protein [Pseudomonas psychrotolerans]QNQ99814.1 hypothetical protein BGI51_20440 [Pseudomonas psychrotolerans]
MTFTDILVPTYRNLLGALSAWLGKAEAQRPDGTAKTLLAARLAPDMFPLATQIRFACVQAQEGMLRLHDQAFPPELTDLLNEGRNAGEQPGTLAQAQTRIRETLDRIEAISGTGLSIQEGAPVAHELPQGLVFDFTAEQYVRDWALPQFYFHVMTAYAILRAQGVELGKADYIAHVLPYLRPGASS